MRRRVLIGIFAAVLALSACGSKDGELHPGGPDGVMIQIVEVSGFVPFEVSISYGPSYTLTTDGILISPGAVPAIYPGPLVYPNFATKLTPGELGQIQAMIERIGLPDMENVEEDNKSDFLADAGTTVITYWDSKGKHRFAVYALGHGGGDSPAAQTFAELRETLQELGWSREQTPYTPEKVQVIVGESMQHVEDDFVDVRPWPISDTEHSLWAPFVDGWRCRVFGPEVLERFDTATQVTTWTNPAPGPETLILLVRALQPGEDDCSNTPR